MYEREMEENEVINESLQMIVETEKKYKWMICRIGTSEVFMPDTTDALGHDVFCTYKFECRMPEPDTLVSAFPLKYLHDRILREEFTTNMKYGDADRSKVSFWPSEIGRRQ